MLGAIIGDLAGSIYEFDQFTQHSKVKIKSIIEDNSFFSDDTILTVAIADAIAVAVKTPPKGIPVSDNIPGFTARM